MFRSIKNGAIFVSDVHYNKQRVEFDNFLDYLIKNQPTQLFLIGDIFDMLAYELNYFKYINKAIIDKINQLSNLCEIFYFEGNHDFNLKKLFPSIEVFPFYEQPVIFNINNKKVAISHGDRFESLEYKIYTTFIRNRFVLKAINFIDINNFISKIIEKNLIDKKICGKFSFNSKERVRFYSSDLIIEGHFHIGLIEEKYINLPAFACKKEYIIYKNGLFKIKDINVKNG